MRGLGPAVDPRFQLFAALFGLATVHHELQFILEQQRTGPLANYMERWAPARPTIGWPSEVGIAIHLADLLLGAMLICLPFRRALLMVAAPLWLLSNVTSPERIASHNSLMLGALAIIFVLGLGELVERTVRRRVPHVPATDWYAWTLTGLKALCAITYAFAALHKLNWAFLSLATSTAPPFALLFTDPLGIPRDVALPVVGYPTIYGTVAIEAGLPILLLIRRTRLPACLLGVVFHLAMMARGIFDFPTLIVGFYPLFLSAEECRAFLTAVTRRPSARRLIASGVLAGVGIATASGSAYVHDLYANPADLDPLVAWTHSSLMYATICLFAYVAAVLGGMLLGRRSPGPVEARAGDAVPLAAP